MRRTCLLCLAALCLAAQTPAPSPQPVIRVTTRLVEINVVVHDKSGPVADLTKDDFILTEKGKPRGIAAFSVDSTKTSLNPPAPLAPNIFTNHFDARAAAQSSVTVVLLDGLNTRFQDQAYAKAQFIKFLRQIDPNDHIALYALGAQLHVLHDFTSDQASLKHALAKFTGHIATELDASEPAPSDTGNDDFDQAMDDMNQLMADRYTVNRVEQTVAAMQAIAEHVKQVPGRKNLIWISGSFPFSIGLDEPLSTTNPAREHRAFNDEIESAARAMNDANVAIYPVDARGLVGMPSMGADARLNPARPGRNGQPPKQQSFTPTGLDTMEELALRTGGRPFYNTNDIQNAIRAALDDAEVTYTLGFYPDPDTLDNKFHEVKVQVKRKGLNVRYRKGYFAFPDRPRTARQLAFTVRDAIWSPLEAVGVGLTARVEPAEKPKPGSLRLLIAIDTHSLSLTRQDGKWTGQAELYIAEKSGAGEMIFHTDDPIAMNLPQAQYDLIVKKGLVLSKYIEIAPAAKQVRVIVIDRPSGAVGSLRINLPVPAPKS
ncbi:MAG: VWA domain-containing protein [Bryobacteraceae bacterium]